MDLQLTSTTTSGSKTSVFKTNPANIDAYPVTIDASNLVAGDLEGDAFPGILPEGFILGKITADSTHAKYDDGNSDGTETLRGLLRRDVYVASATSVVHGAIVLGGVVVDESKLPETVDANGKTDVGDRFIWD